jgi:hypothetical protein
VTLDDLDGDGRADDFVSFTSGDLRSYIMKPVDLTIIFSDNDFQVEKLLQSSKNVELTVVSPDRLYLEINYTSANSNDYTSRLTMDHYNYNTTSHKWYSTISIVGLSGPLGSHEIPINVYYAGCYVTQYMLTFKITM